jgi:thiol-disulfide isomerase/thioredoxin
MYLQCSGLESTGDVAMKMLLATIATALLAISVNAAEVSGPAPDITLKSTSGTNVRLADLKGKVVMVNFWASWCGPCRQEMPILEKIYKDYKDAGFVLLGVNVDAEISDRDKFLSETTVTFPILDDSANVATEEFGVEAMPSTYFVDKNGNLAHLHKGYKPGEEADYIAQIKKLLSK